MAWGALTITLGTVGALLGFLAVGLLALGDKRNGQVGIAGLGVLGLGIALAIAAAATVQLS